MKDEKKDLKKKAKKEGRMGMKGRYERSKNV